MKTSIFTLFIMIIFIYCSSSLSNEEEVVIDETANEITYTASSDVISNPERGFMHSWSVASEGTALSKVTLNSLRNENVTIILRFAYNNNQNETDAPLV